MSNQSDVKYITAIIIFFIDLIYFFVVYILPEYTILLLKSVTPTFPRRPFKD